MNQFLKAVIKEAFDAEALVVDVVMKAWAKLLQDGVAAGMDAVSLAGSLGSAKSDLEALVANPAADADLLAYVAGLSVGLSDAKAQAIVVAASKMALDLVVDAEALFVAIKS